jgi:hypothetical protein
MTLMSGEEAVQFIFCAPAESVVALGGVDGAALSELVDHAEHVPNDRRALFVRLQPAGSVDACVAQIVEALADTAMRLWPVWFTDVSFAMCRDDALGREAASVIAREAARRLPGVNSAWAEAAARLTLVGRPPRVAGATPATELFQLSLAVSRLGPVLVVDAGAASDAPGVLTHALEWVARHACTTVVALFPELPPLDSPFDCILYGFRTLCVQFGKQ